MSAGYYSSVELEETRPTIIKNMDTICVILEKEFKVELEAGLIDGETFANYIWALTVMGDDSKEWETLKALNVEPLKTLEHELTASENVEVISNLASYGFTSALVVNEEGGTYLIIGTNTLGDIMTRIGNKVYGVIH